MKIKDLVNELNKCDQNTEVFVNDEECHERIFIKLDVLKDKYTIKCISTLFSLMYFNISGIIAVSTSLKNTLMKINCNHLKGYVKILLDHYIYTIMILMKHASL